VGISKRKNGDGGEGEGEEDLRVPPCPRRPSLAFSFLRTPPLPRRTSPLLGGPISQSIGIANAALLDIGRLPPLSLSSSVPFSIQGGGRGREGESENGFQVLSRHSRRIPARQGGAQGGGEKARMRHGKASPYSQRERGGETEKQEPSKGGGEASEAHQSPMPAYRRRVHGPMTASGPTNST
jgi:hypothetical protein